MDMDEVRARARAAEATIWLLEGLLAHVDCGGVLPLRNGTVPLQGVLLALGQAREDLAAIRRVIDG